MNKIKKSVQSGFTLIELIAVMVILGILAAVIIPAIGSLTAGAYQSNAQTMYGAIKNAVNNQAVKNAMTGQRLKTYPEISSGTINNYLDSWIEDYDSEYWCQIRIDNHITNANGTDNSHPAAIFCYFPHGIPQATINGTDISAVGTAGVTSKEDVYYIVYAGITTADGKDGGVENDGYTLVLWHDDNQDWDLDGTTAIAANETATYTDNADSRPSAEFVHSSKKAAD